MTIRQLWSRVTRFIIRVRIAICEYQMGVNQLRIAQLNRKGPTPAALAIAAAVRIVKGPTKHITWKLFLADMRVAWLDVRMRWSLLGLAWERSGVR